MDHDQAFGARRLCLAKSCWGRYRRDIAEELDVDPARYIERRIIRRKYVRKDRAEQAPVIAPLKPRLIEGSYAGAEERITLLFFPANREGETPKMRYD